MASKNLHQIPVSKWSRQGSRRSRHGRNLVLWFFLFPLLLIYFYYVHIHQLRLFPPHLGICVRFRANPLPLCVAPSTAGTFVIQIGTLPSSCDRKAVIEEGESISWLLDISSKAERIKTRK